MEPQTAASSLRSLFGETRFRNDRETLQSYASSLNGPTVEPSGVVFPVTTEEIISLMEIAGRFNLRVFPVSRGKNYGYGEAQGTAPGQIIADLSRMNKILEVNETLAYATIQPGVSQEDIHTHLKASGSRLQLDVTGGGLHASLVGNILERGFGHTDYGDRYNRVINMTIITPEGKTIRTGFGDHRGANAVNAYRYGTGPLIDGLFSQSNYGIVVEMTIEMMPQPEKSCMFIVTTKDENALGSLVEAIRELKLTGVVNSAVHFANKARATGSEATKLAGAWNMSGSVSGPSALVRARKKVVRRTLIRYCPSVTIWFIDDKLMRLAKWVYEHITPFSLYPPLQDAWDLQKGIPTDNPLRILFNDPALQSATLNTGNYETCFSWINAVCLAEKASVERLLEITRQQFETGGYEFRITFTAITPRALIMITNTTYPRTDAEIARAKVFSDTCYKALISNGFLPYRAGSGMYGKMPLRSPALQELLDKIKSAVDPGHILAPGKYNID